MKKYYVLLSFLLPALYRLGIEIYSWPFTIGFDTMAYYLPYLLGYDRYDVLQLYSQAPLYYILISYLNTIAKNSMITLKVMAIMLHGFLGLTLYLWAKSILLSKNRAFIYSMLTSFYFVTLRLLWDLHRNVLGLVLMLATLWLINYGEYHGGKCLRYIIGFTAFLTALAHQIEPIILSILLIPKVFKRSRDAITALFTTLITWLSIVVLYSFDTNSTGYFERLFIEKDPLIPQGVEVLELALYIFLPLMPFSIVGMIRSWRRSKELIIWILFCIMTAPLINAGFRLLLLITIPLMIYAVTLGRRAVTTLTIITLTLAIGYTTLPPEKPFPYFSQPIMWNTKFKYAIPTSMQQNTVSLEISHKVMEALNYTINKVSNEWVIITDRTFIGYLLLLDTSFSSEVKIYSEIMQYEPICSASERNQDTYVLWLSPRYKWHNLTLNTLPIVLCREPIALYRLRCS